QMYKGQLMQAFQDCPYLVTEIPSEPLEYAKNDIEMLFEEYNHCKGAKIIYQEPKDKGKVVFTLNGGVNFSNIKFESISYPPWNDYHFNGSVGFALGFGGDFLLPRTEGKWGFFNELSIKTFKCDGDLKNEQNVLKLDLVYLKLATMMHYYLTNDKKETRPYFGFGIANSIAIKFVNLDYSKNPEGDPLLDYFRTYEQGLLFSFGTYYKRWNGELRYEFSNGISGYTSLKSPAHTAYILIGYKLFEL
ncbi:MAG: outer membrane beta-barrel protein, partial [Chitinophagales bacterium]